MTFFVMDESGATAVEYIGRIAAVIIVMIYAFGRKVARSL
jgi:Flp pilus assembly pilin Flp